ncbi:choice-of-anchor B family protein [candidate division KSB1 bacterium]|nr:choice-of-anchor B family protein [candidate division KSB1 bacterium]NIR71180.1 choice-of-anchor B family protein [candidate division KSB1 bacterium]NIS26165.1 choice-of-anchor B family protein [candidate division KSB1 bacterium]NIT72930.1 choice-of-anchor B family protein [candidate division KSB1 bacterium]NIU26812.1 choice-of-anchor B family protein [candidate division KSB1 bacterium]
MKLTKCVLAFAVTALLLKPTFAQNSEPIYRLEIGQNPVENEGSIALVGRVPVVGGVTDIWGYFDPDTEKEYAIIGFGLFTQPPNSGVVIVDVSDPSAPEELIRFNSVPGFDVKVWRNYLYTVSGTGPGMGSIVDISDLSHPKVVGSMPSAHNIFIDARGIMYLECPGLRIYDLRRNPAQPELLWEDPFSGCHDATVVGTRLYAFHGNQGTVIFDVSDPTTPEIKGSIDDLAIRVHHSGWPTEGGNFLFICDEGARHPTPDITVWDIRDLENPEKVAEIADPMAIVHNLFIVGDFAFTSYYTAGFRVFDISNPRRPRLVDEYDTSNISGESFGGAFGAYPFTRSGHVFVSDQDLGLFVFAFDSNPTSVSSGAAGISAGFALLGNYPNPFNPETTISYQLAEQSPVKITIYNQIGKIVRTLLNASQTAGLHRIKWDGKDDAGRAMSSGIYFYQVTAGEFKDTKRMLLLK